jgi:class 3 adenylate cyclase/tetratricopeptide (TPR) repeat protein
MGRSGFDRGGRPSSLVRTIPPFVGRRQEVQQVAQWLNDGVAGRPCVILIQGEAGIGKTRFLQELRSSAQRLQMQVCYGRCSEDLALPYLPFIESLLPELVKFTDSEQVSGPELEVIQRLLHRGNPVAAAASSSMPGQADQDKLQLFLAVGHGTARLAQRRPILFVVDDLHWADRLSLDLFDHLALAVAEVATREAVPLVIVGTYRPPEPGDRLARLIARLQRERICRSFTLHGLTELEVQELIGGLGLVRPSHQLTATVSEATQGNPLFVQEVLDHLVRQDALREQGGYLVTATEPSDLRLPDQVTGAIVARAQGLSEGCRRVLTAAAFVGERFSVDVVAAVSGVPEHGALDLLEEATRLRLLRSEGPEFQFAHPLIRHVFYHEPSVARRERIHKEIAESLERLYAGRTDEHLLEIAHHLVRAGSAAPADAVIEYARRAADHAFRVFAWSEAAHYCEAALAASESTGRLTAEDRASLHYSAGLAHYYDRDVGPCLHHYEKAIEAYRQLGDLRGLARSLMEKTRTLTITALPLGALGDIQPLEDVLAALGEGEPQLRGHIAAVMAEAYRNSRQAEKAREKAQQALEIGQQLEDDDLSAYASFALSLAHINDLNVSEALEVGRRARAFARRATDVIREGWALHRIPLYLTLLGEIAEAQAVAEEACELTRQTHDWWNHSIGLSHLACLTVVKGDFGGAERHAHETMLMVSRSQYPWGGLRSLLALACARALRGAWVEAEDALDLLLEPGRVFKDPGSVVGTFARVFRRLLVVYSGVANGDLEGLAADLIRVVGTDSYSLAPLCALVELGDLAAAPAIADLALPALSRAAERGVLFSTGWMFLIPRVLGNADAANRRWDVAEAHFQSALDVATRRGARPELGRSYLDYARMLASRGARNDRPRAIEMVSQAGAIFLEVGMPPFTREAARLAEKLRSRIPSATKPRVEYPDNLDERDVQVLVRMAEGQSGQEIASDLVLGQKTVADHVRRIFVKTSVKDEAAAVAYAAEKGLTLPGEVERDVGKRPTPSLRIILVTDVVASGVLIHRAGDAKAHDLMQIHNEIIRLCLATHDGTEITHTGDGLEASFDSASSAVACAVAIQQMFAQHNAEHPAEAIRVRVGVHAGQPISTEGRLFGTAVHAAFRICARAGPGQILVSDVVGQPVAGKGFVLSSRGRVALKGLPGRMQLYEVLWERRPA